MPRQSDRVTISKQLEQLIELQILDDDSTSSSESDLEMLDLLSTDADSADSVDSRSDLDRDEDIMDDSDTDYEDDIADLDALREVLQHSRHFTRGDRRRSLCSWRSR
ncbi:hypothetical protein R1sor_011895 [Riccia sorocarpa]|uniref:Uncharacterized protein n=1 Tax=Riccia sorocarpa TaxID=122646 RepID=A0ABD3I8E2_9MARC